MTLRDKKTSHGWEVWSSPPQVPTFSKVWLLKRVNIRLSSPAWHFRNDVHFSIICALAFSELLPVFQQTTCWLASLLEVFQTWIYLIIHQVAAMTLMECIMLATKRWNFKCTCVQELGMIKQVTATPDFSTYPTAFWLCRTREAGKLRAWKHPKSGHFPTAQPQTSECTGTELSFTDFTVDGSWALTATSAVFASSRRLTC